MSTRTGGSMSFMAGLMAPRKFDKILIDYTSATITNYGYFANGVFISRIEIEINGSSEEIRTELFNTVGPF